MSRRKNRLAASFTSEKPRNRDSSGCPSGPDENGGKAPTMKKLIATAAIATAVAAAPVAPAAASEITTKTLAYTFVFALAGTAAGAVLIPYAAPAAAPDRKSTRLNSSH